MKSRRMKWAEHVALMGRGNVDTGLWWGSLRERHHLQDTYVDERITLRWIFRNMDVGEWTGSSWLRLRTAGACCESGNDN